MAAWWKFWERRDSGYSGIILSAAEAAAAGGGTDARGTAMVEAAAGLVSRAFASATASEAVFDAPLLALIGRQLMRRGEVVLGIGGDASGLRLIPASSWTVTGGHDPKSWKYRISLDGPTATLDTNVSADSVLHFRFAYEPGAPWRGISPLEYAAISGQLSARTIAALNAEANMPHSHLLPIPQAGGDDESLGLLKQDLAGRKGGLHLVESMGDSWQSGEKAPRGDWQSVRLGADPPQGLVLLRDAAAREVLAACGIPPALVDARSAATAVREAWRQVLFGLIAPLGKLIEAEVRAKLFPGFSLRFDEIRGSDITARARAWRSLAGQEAAMTPRQAADIVGFNSEVTA